MAARQIKTPGATTPTPEEVKQSDLDAVLGTPEDQDTQDQDASTSTASEPVTTPTPEEIAAKKEYEEFLAWRNNKAAEPVARNVPASGVGSEPVAKRTRSFLGKDGWTTEEY